jgi:hypothetical protein
MIVEQRVVSEEKIVLFLEALYRNPPRVPCENQEEPSVTLRGSQPQFEIIIFLMWVRNVSTAVPARFLHLVTNYILSRGWVTTDGVWIDNWISLTDRNCKWL